MKWMMVFGGLINLIQWHYISIKLVKWMVCPILISVWELLLSWILTIIINIFFLGLILVYLHPFNNHPNRSSNYRQYFNELSIQCCDFSNGFDCGDFH